MYQLFTTPVNGLRPSGQIKRAQNFVDVTDLEKKLKYMNETMQVVQAIQCLCVTFRYYWDIFPLSKTVSFTDTVTLVLEARM